MIVLNKSYNWLFSFLIASFIFLWGMEISYIPEFFQVDILGIDKNSSPEELKKENISKLAILNLLKGQQVPVYNPRFNILLLLIPIFFKIVKFSNFKKNLIFFFKKNYTKIKIFILFFIFLILHFLLSNFLNDAELKLNNFLSLSFLIILSFIYIYYRKLIILNLNKIIFIFIILLILTTIFGFFATTDHPSFDYCTQKFLIYLFNDKDALEVYNNREYWSLLKLNEDLVFFQITNVFYDENAHLGMVFPAVLFYLIFKSQNNIKYFYIAILTYIISLLFVSTTLLAGIVVSGTIINIYILKVKKKIDKIILLNSFFIIISTLIFFSDKNCSKKITDINFNLKKVSEKGYFNSLGSQNLDYGYDEDIFSTDSFSEPDASIQNIYKIKNSTSTVAERSVAVTVDTLLNNFWGWGYGNNDIGTLSYLNKQYKDNLTYIPPGHLEVLNLKDSLGNIFKLLTEFGLFFVIFFYYLYKYVINDKKVYSYKIFFIGILFVQLFRAAGYLNGGFCLAIFEVLFYRKFSKSI